VKVSPALKGLLSRAVPLLLLAAAATVVLAPSGIGFSTGIHSGNAPNAEDFAKYGCTSCHGEHNVFPARDATEAVRWRIEAEDGTPLNGPYDPHLVYVITITLNETEGVGEENRAGFNLAASSGTLEGVDGESQVSGDGTQATHVDPSRTSWSVRWTPPEEGPAVFGILVNDVDGDGAPSPDDVPYRTGFFITDAEGALPGAVHEEHVEFGISLQQYWIGLIGLFGMILVMVAAFAYLKFSNPHHTDAKDR
jgi:hypothetical protein